MSSGHEGRGLDQWKPSLRQNEDQSRHAWYVDAERGWWIGTCDIPPLSRDGQS
jgi:hypothetical protein